MNWPLIPVKDLCDLAVDCVNKTAPVVDHETPYKMIRTTNIKKGFINIDEVKYVSKETFEKWTRRSQPKFGDIILTREAPVGEVGRFTFQDSENIFLGQRLFHYRPNPLKLDWNFLAYALQSEEVQARLQSKAFGATVPHVKVGEAESLLIPCPDLKDQKKIGSILSSYDDLITINQRRIALLEDAARRLYREWFVNLRFPGHELGTPFTPPKTWKTLSLFEICDVAYGFPFKSTHFNSDRNGIPAIRIRDIPSLSPSTYTTEEADPSYLIEEEDFLIGMDGIFHMNHWPGPTSYLVQRVCRVRAKNKLMQAYIGLALHDPIKNLESSIQGSTVAHLGAKHLKQIEILIPQGQNKVLEFFNNQMLQIIQLRKANNALMKARDLLLPRLMSGKLDVSNIPLPEEVLA